MPVKWLRLALADLVEAAGYIAQSDPDAAKRIVARIWQATQILAEQPGIGRPGRVRGTRELLVSGTPYIVPYRVVGDAVQILRVLHTPRKCPKGF